MLRLTYGQSVVDIVDNVKYIVDSVKKVAPLGLSATREGLDLWIAGLGKMGPAGPWFSRRLESFTVCSLLSSGPPSPRTPFFGAASNPARTPSGTGRYFGSTTPGSTTQSSRPTR